VVVERWAHPGQGLSWEVTIQVLDPVWLDGAAGEDRGGAHGMLRSWRLQACLRRGRYVGGDDLAGLAATMDPHVDPNGTLRLTAAAPWGVFGSTRTSGGAAACHAERGSVALPRFLKRPMRNSCRPCARRARSGKARRSDSMLERPDVLYQYTDASGFLSSLERQELWESNAAFLDDLTKLIYIREGLRRLGTSFGLLIRMRPTEATSRGVPSVYISERSASRSARVPDRSSTPRLCRGTVIARYVHRAPTRASAPTHVSRGCSVPERRSPA
jgi:hypothetical protein